MQGKILVQPHRLEARRKKKFLRSITDWGATTVRVSSTFLNGLRFGLRFVGKIFTRNHRFSQRPKDHFLWGFPVKIVPTNPLTSPASVRALSKWLNISGGRMQWRSLAEHFRLVTYWKKYPDAVNILCENGWTWGMPAYLRYCYFSTGDDDWPVNFGVPFHRPDQATRRPQIWCAQTSDKTSAKSHR